MSGRDPGFRAPPPPGDFRGEMLRVEAGGGKPIRYGELGAACSALTFPVPLRSIL